jgi:hypothetical protein
LPPPPPPPPPPLPLPLGFPPPPQLLPTTSFSFDLSEQSSSCRIFCSFSWYTRSERAFRGIAEVACHCCLCV